MRRYSWMVWGPALLLLAACGQANVRSESGGANAAKINTELGVQYMREGNTQMAMQTLQKALRQDSSLAAAHNAIAVLYESLDQFDKADEHFQRAVSLDPKDPKAQNNYGGFLCRHDRWKEAEAHFQRAANDPLYGSPELALTNAGTCAEAAGELDKAEQYLRKALDRNPKYAAALLRMASLSLKQQKYLQARAYLQRYQAVAPNTSETLWIGIQTEQHLGDKDAVASYRLQLKNNFPDSPQAKQVFGTP